MDTRKFKFQDGRGGSALAIRVSPRSQKNEVTRIFSDGTINVKLKAPLVDGKANNILIKFLAEILEVKHSELEIIAGETGRNKLVSIYGLDSETVNQHISELLSKSKKLRNLS